MKNEWTETNASDWSDSIDPPYELPPLELTESIRRRISTFFYLFHIGKGGRCKPPRVIPSDRLCRYFGFLDMKRPQRRLY